MSVRARLVLFLAALVAVTAAWVPASSGAPVQTLWVYYTMSCTFRLADDTGRTVSGGTIPPGAYQVIVNSPVPFAQPDLSGINDLTACRGSAMFRLTGPGVSTSTTLEDGDSAQEQRYVTFQPNSTYTAQDDNNVAGTRTTFTTSDTPGIALSPVTTPGSAPSDSTSKSAQTADVVGSALLPLRGTLAAVVTATGKLTLSFGGKSVENLKAGRYTIAVSDRSAHSGFVIDRIRKQPLTLAGPAFVGKRSESVTLTAGQWSYYSPGGHKSYFVVVA